MSKIQIGKRSTKATEFIEGVSAFMNSEGNFVAGEFIEIDTPNISKMHKVSKAFETFEIIENSENTDFRVVAKFNVTSTTEETQIVSDDYTSGFSKIEIDGVEQPSVVSSYTFDTLGEHIVKYTLTDPTSIGEYAFWECSDLTNITIPSSVISIGDYAFSNCSSLTSVTFAEGSQLTSIGECAFLQCRSLASITIPSGVISIGFDVFAGCRSLASITIPNGVTSIGDSAFFACNGLTSVTIQSSVTNIGDYAFLDCGSLSNVTCLPTTPPTLGTSVFDNNAMGRKIYVPSESETAYEQATNWSAYASDIEPIPNS